MTAVPAALVALTLNVPFLPQTPALCGGAAVAMVFRYWGDRHADVQQFASLVDRRAGGIADAALVEAVRERRWRALPLEGSLDRLRARLAAGEPPIVLLEDRPGRYHYVVVVGSDEEAVYVHDPTWGPRRTHRVADFLRRWRAARHWMLVILPGEAGRREAATAPAPPGRAEPSTPRTGCARLLDGAVEEIGRRGLPAADAILDDVIAECPGSAAPIAELAAIRFTQNRWKEAEALAEEAAALDPSYAYAWDVLGSARFVGDDPEGALGAWNRAGKPYLDSVQIAGLSRTRYALVAQFAGLTPNTILTPSAYRLAERRLRDLPDQLAVRVGFTPDADGFAVVRVAVAERPARPQGAPAWLAAGARALVARELRTIVPGWAGEGEVWGGSWRWWPNRPRVALDFSAPRTGPLRGISRVDLSWERQTYGTSGAATIEERTHGGFSTSDWLAPDLRYQLAAGVDAWSAARRTVSIGGALERRLLDDRLALAAGGELFVALAGTPGFSTGTLSAAYRSSRGDRGLVHRLEAGLDGVTRAAPLALWSGAGDGLARPHLLRAHPLLVDGRLDGTVFGRRVVHATFESERPVLRRSLVRVGAAAFVDAASASGRLDEGRAGGVDVGAGLRIRIPGAGGFIRADLAHGLGDGRNRFSVGLVRDRF